MILWKDGGAFSQLTFLLLAIVFLANSSYSTQTVRRRLRRPSIKSKPSEESLSGDQDVSASINRFKIKNRTSAASSANSAVAAASSKSSVKSSKDDPKYKIVCYYTNWSQYRTKIGKFQPEDISPDLCTHIIFAFGWLKKGKLSSFESNDETKDGKVGLYDRIDQLKKANPKLKTLLAIGGWSFGTQKFKEMSKTRYSRQTFIYSAVPYLRQRNFDGLDIDWEYPAGTDDKKNYVLLLKELREAFEAEAQEVKKSRLLLTAAVPVGPDNIKGGYDVPAVAGYLDFINLMAYDFHGKWEREVGHNAPLRAPSTDSEWRKQLSVENAANMWVRLGAPKEKLIIGMPTYGRTFTLANPEVWKVNSPATGGGKAGEYTKESGFLAYYEVCEMLRNGASYVWDDEMKVPYLVHGDQWVGFDDEKSIRYKMNWLKDGGYGGAMVWTVDMDDFTGNVCGGDVKYPLIGAMREELNGISRGSKAKDVDWAKVAGTLDPETVTKPAPVKIAVSDLLNKAKKPTIQKQETSNLIDTKVRPAQIFCYMTSWSQARPGAGKFGPENIDAKLCTHVIYAFGTLKEHKLTLNEDKEKDEAGKFEALIQLREKNPDIKILLAIGGWAFGSTPFKELTGNTFRMNQFVYESIEFLREHKFNGLDVDWEYPRGADDRASYVNLLKELRMAFEGEAKTSGDPRLLLTAAVPASFEAIAAGYDVPEISKYLDFINVMTYDFHGQWERQVGHNSPLKPLEGATSYQKKLTVEYSAKEWVKQGAPKEKLMIGMPTYGRSFTLVDETKFDIGAPASGGGEPGKYTAEAGFMSYYEVCDFLKKDNTTLVWDNEQQVPFAYRDDQWVGFDDERSLKMKMDWLKEDGYGGIMVWSVDMDDFRGQCGSGKYPLISTMKNELDDYSVALEYDGPYETYSPTGKYTTKEPNAVSCEEEDGHISYHADKADCTHYYMCEGERKHHMPCPSNLVFNPKENVCDWPENVETCLHHTQAPPPSK
uniref:Probable chitinase 3 n=1 Tax=Cacopsylla melanoneura TaxID=428564 RepID=A0A8D8USC8_9HEMI